MLPSLSSLPITSIPPRKCGNSSKYPRMMRPASDSKPKYSDIMSTREELIKHPGLLLQLRNSGGRQVGPGCKRERGLESLGVPWGGGSTSPKVGIQVFHTTIYTFLACVYEVQKLSDHKNTLVFVLIVKQLRKLSGCQNIPIGTTVISPRITLRLICVPENSGGCVNKNADEFTRDDSGFCSTVCRTRTNPGDFRAEHYG